jgi:hypothetical protein
MSLCVQWLKNFQVPKHTKFFLFLLFLFNQNYFLSCLDFVEILTKDFTVLKTSLVSLSFLSMLALLKRAYSTRLKSSNHAKMSAIQQLWIVYTFKFHARFRIKLAHFYLKKYFFHY